MHMSITLIFSYNNAIVVINICPCWSEVCWTTTVLTRIQRYRLVQNIKWKCTQSRGCQQRYLLNLVISWMQLVVSIFIPQSETASVTISWKDVVLFILLVAIHLLNLIVLSTRQLLPCPWCSYCALAYWFRAPICTCFVNMFHYNCWCRCTEIPNLIVLESAPTIRVELPSEVKQQIPLQSCLQMTSRTPVHADLINCGYPRLEMPCPMLANQFLLVSHNMKRIKSCEVNWPEVWEMVRSGSGWESQENVKDCSYRQ